MRKLFIIPLFFIGCTSVPSHNTVAVAEQPKALQEESSYDIVSKSYGRSDGLIESIYNELIEKNAELKALDERIKVLNYSQEDSLKTFNFYNSKNTSYYNSAQSYISNISDSLLKKEIESIVKKSETNYHLKIDKHKALEELISSKTKMLNDLYVILKLTKTLTVMENYQNTSFPNKKSMTALEKEIELTISTINKEMLNK